MTERELRGKLMDILSTWEAEEILIHIVEWGMAEGVKPINDDNIGYTVKQASALRWDADLFSWNDKFYIQDGITMVSKPQTILDVLGITVSDIVEKIIADVVTFPSITLIKDKYLTRRFCSDFVVQLLIRYAEEYYKNPNRAQRKSVIEKLKDLADKIEGIGIKVEGTDNPREVLINDILMGIYEEDGIIKLRLKQDITSETVEDLFYRLEWAFLFMRSVNEAELRG